MKKCRLNLDELDVESFATSASMPQAGTVRAYETEYTCNYDTCDYGTCTANYYTCDAQCGTVNTADVDNTCNIECYGGGGGGFTVTMHTACLDCYTNANTCTMVQGCRYPTQLETCTC